MQKRALQVKISFESNRLTEVYIANAYEKLIPIIKHSTNSVKAKTTSLKFKGLQQAQGY
jgi:hypothetical protein